jgi:hypothetical protein
MNRRITILGFLLLGLSPYAQSQKQTTGTIIVFAVSDQYIAVAADSKMIEVNTGNVKSKCKITALGDKFIFANAGMKFLQSSSRRELRWDADEQARNAFRLLSAGPVNNPDFTVQVAKEWVRSTKQEFTQMTLSDPVWFWNQVKDTHIRAFFGGFDSMGKIGIVDVHIDLIRQVNNFVENIESYGEDANIIYFAIGETQIASEFILLKTDRAKKEYQRWKNTVRGKSQEEQASLRTIDLVRLCIKYPPPDNGIGPPIHALTLKSSGRVQWILGKGCKQEINNN